MSRAPDSARVATDIVAHFRAIQRDLPWRRSRDPYAIWVSEVMLQQTRVAAVIPYFERWMARLPTVRDLAEAPLDTVLAAWAGLGYYSRARNLHAGAQMVVTRYGGQIPSSVPELLTIPGIGRYTAGAIASIAFSRREPVVDGNVARVLARIYEIDSDIKSSAAMRQLWHLAGELVPEGAPGDFNQGLMELGATICTPTRPACLLCPVREECRARSVGREHELPVMPARKRPDDLPLIDAHALWIERRGRVLLARRPPEGLYGGLWELPQTENLGSIREVVPARVVALGAEPLVEHRQVLTHRRLRIRVYQADIEGRIGKPRGWYYDMLAWQAIERAEERALSAATRAIVTKLRDRKSASTVGEHA